MNERSVAAAFSRQSLVFDDCNAGNAIIRYKRWRVRAHAERFLAEGSRILELNAGTGEDALYFAGQGHSVHATDIAAGMLDRLAEKAGHHPGGGRVTQELCSFTTLGGLSERGPYDMVFSNFAGLNCTADLDKVLVSCGPLLKPGGLLTLVLLPRFCLWEFLLLFRGKWRTAFRRFSGRKGAPSHIEGHHFGCWYYNPSYVMNTLGGSFELVRLEGLCVLVPPSYIEGFAVKHPGWHARLCRWENRLKTRWPWTNIGDYYIITLKKKGPL